MLVLEYRVNAMVLSGIDSQRLIMYEKKTESIRMSSSLTNFEPQT
jgi:hypothetical protein